MRAKKYLGQHFLKNKKILREIAAAAELSKKDVVLEVGPGHGELTEFLAKYAKKVIAVEKDRELVPLLKNKFEKVKNVRIVQGDILKIQNSTIKNQNDKSKFKIVANLPYYLTSRFLRTFLEAKNKPKLMVLMVQHEVAKRICARPPNMNLLALSVQAYAQPKFIRRVSRKYFSPVPKVDAALIKISPRQIDQPAGLIRVLGLARLAFQQKRKMLRHSLGLTKSGFGEKRPQELSLEEWKKFSKSTEGLNQ